MFEFGPGFNALFPFTPRQHARARGTRIAVAAVLLLFLLAIAPGRAQDFVYPERPGQSNVRWYRADWRVLDVPVAIGDEHATVRLYYYEQERAVTELARASIEQSVQRLARTFDYVPERPIPYVLYASYQEFLRTNLFPVQEGVLGVTSPRNLALTLPYFGDHRLFEDVSTHELAHEMTIQKLAHVARINDASRSAIEVIPLWFVEGLAEYYAQGGMDTPGGMNPESALRLRDLVVNQAPRRGHWLGSFYDEGPGTVLWIYQAGQARCAFLESTYGVGTVQRILDLSHRLVGTTTDGGLEPLRTFADLVELVTGDDRDRVTAKFAHWIKRRAFEPWLAADEDRPDLLALKHERGAIQALAAAPDGSFVAYRSVEANTGQSRLWLADPRASARPKKAAKDGVPGSETLHPVDRRNFAIGEHRLAYVTESRGRDTIRIETWDRTVKERKHVPAEKKDFRFRVRFHLDRERTIDLRAYGLRGAYSPAFAPDESRLAFVGLDEDGQRDLYVLDLRSPEAPILRLTSDEFAEREVSWGPKGVVYNSDRTADGRYNLFVIDPDHPESVSRLTDESRDEAGPLALPDGRVFFTAYEGDASNLYEIGADGAVVQRTDVATGVFSPAPGPDGQLWTLLRFEGAEHAASIPVDRDYGSTPAAGTVAAPAPLPRASTEASVPYVSLAPRNWSVETAFGLLGIAGSELFGQLYVPATDRLRNHSLVLSLTAYGSLELTEAYLLYADQSRRATWGFGPFQTPRYRYDQSLASEGFVVSSYERFFGGLVSVRQPLDRFLYAQGDLRVGGTDYFLFGDAEEAVADAGLLTIWEQRNLENRFQAEVGARVGYDTIRYHSFTGPIAGRSLLLQTTLGTQQPMHDVVYGTARIDAAQYVPIIGSANLFLRGGAGASLPGPYATWFYLYSFETLRGVPFGDPAFLLGRHFLYGKAELQVPLDPILDLFLASHVEGVLGVDAGSVSDELADVLGHPVLDGVLGANLIFGPLEIKLHFAYPFDLGDYPRPSEVWVTNLSFGWLYQ